MIYTRGSVIPLYLVLKSRDKQAVDLLANPQAVRIGLGRILTFPSRFAPVLDSHIGSAARSCRVAWKAIEPESTTSGLTGGRGETASGTFVQVLYGELALPPLLTPSFTFGQFSLKVRDWQKQIISRSNV